MKRPTIADMVISSTSTLLAIAGLISVASISPGPNNLLVIRAALRSGLSGALPYIAGVIVGSLGLMILVIGGLQSVFESTPTLRSLVVVAGSVYLGWLGVSMMRTAPPLAESSMHYMPDGAVARVITAATFQFLNPKSWVLVLSAIAAAHTSAAAVFFEVGTMLVIIPAISLTIWSILGVILMRFLSQPAQRRRFDRAMGILLIISAALMLRSV
jgi:threonine/homoserine/homoserine lactone efflux protein